MDLEKLEKELVKTKMGLFVAKNTAFITEIALQLNHVLADIHPKYGFPIDTAATCGEYVVYNPDFFASLTKEERFGLMLHEVWHVAYGHTGTMAKKRFAEDADRKTLNIAMDYVINNMLVEQKIVLPKGGYQNFKYKGTTENVYRQLLSEGFQPSKDYKLDVFDLGGPNVSEQELENLLHKQVNTVYQATIQAQIKQQSNVPGEIEVYLKDITNPVLPWNLLVKQYFNKRIKSKPSFKKRNRRFNKIILPTNYTELTGNVAMIVDMSASVSDYETSQFITDAANCLTSCKLKELTLVQFDTKVFQVDKVKTLQQITDINFKGRGGTSIHPVMKWIDKNKPDVAVIFTDGYFTLPTNYPNIPILWVIYDNPSFTAKGEVYHYPKIEK